MLSCPPWEDVGLGDEYAELCSCGWAVDELGELDSFGIEVEDEEDD